MGLGILTATTALLVSTEAVTIPPYPSADPNAQQPFAQPNLTTHAQPNGTSDFTVDGPPLELVHELHGDFPTANVVSGDGRIFFNLPRSQSDTAATLVEATNFTAEAPYPNSAMQHCTDGQNASTCFVNIQSLDIDSTLNRLWVLDTGTPPNSMEAVPYGGKIMVYNLTTNTMERNYVLPNDIASGGTSINDVRVNLTSNQGYVSDEQGSLITLDLGSGQYTRRFFGAPEVTADPGFVGYYDGEPELYMWKNNSRMHLTTGCDGVALALGWLYFAPSASRRLYRVPQDIVSNRDLADGQILQHVESLGQLGHYTGGFDSDDAGRVYLTNAGQNAVSYLNTSLADLTPELAINDQTVPSTGVVAAKDVQYGSFVRSAYIQWPDSIYVTNGYLYITTNQLPLSPGYQKGNVDRRERPFKLYRAYTGTNHAV